MNKIHEIDKLIQTVDGSIQKRHKEYMNLVPDMNIKLMIEDEPDLESFLKYVCGKKFCRQSYAGAYKKINADLIKGCKKMIKDHENRGQTLMYKESREGWKFILNVYSIFEYWKKYKQVYCFDKDFMEVLMQTDSIKIPTKILKHMPFKSFYLDLSECGFYPILGYFVYVRFDTKTCLPNIYMIRVESDKNENIELCLALFNDEYTFENNIIYAYTEDDGDTYFNITADSCGNDQSIFFALQAILYLSSYKPDIAKNNHRSQGSRKRSSGPNNKSDANINDVGIRYGNKIRASKRTTVPVTAGSRSNNAKGKHKDITGYIRRAHWHLYWTGKGRKIPRYKWLLPTFVLCNKKNPPTTLHKVA